MIVLSKDNWSGTACSHGFVRRMGESHGEGEQDSRGPREIEGEKQERKCDRMMENEVKVAAWRERESESVCVRERGGERGR